MRSRLSIRKPSDSIGRETGVRRPSWICARRADRDRAELQLIAWGELAEREAQPAQRAPAARRHDEQRKLAEPPQRGQVEVVAVQVRHQRGVEAFRRRRSRAGRA